jgi:hypothetical protein
MQKRRDAEQMPVNSATTDVREQVAHMLGRGTGLTDREQLAHMADELVRDALLKRRRGAWYEVVARVLIRNSPAGSGSRRRA